MQFDTHGGGAMREGACMPNSRTCGSTLLMLVGRPLATIEVRLQTQCTLTNQWEATCKAFEHRIPLS